jgi:hypothetical protein
MRISSDVPIDSPINKNTSYLFAGTAGTLTCTNAPGVRKNSSFPDFPNPKSQIKLAPLLTKEGWQPHRLTEWFSLFPDF